MKKIFKNIISLGAYGRVQSANSEYYKNLENLKQEYFFHEKRRKEINNQIKELTKLKRNSIIEIRKVKRITSILTIKQREVLEHYLIEKDLDLNKIEIDISMSEVAFNLGKGSILGYVTGYGFASSSLGLIGTFGTASTGTAISSLSGVAATNATLAWFGGGSLATGGAGMAGGALVIGGIVIIPLVGIAGLVQHLNASKKIKEIKEENLKIAKHLDEIKNNLLSFIIIEKRTEEITISIKKSLEVFEKTFNETYEEIFKYGIISRLIKWFKFKLFKNPYSQNELKKIATLGEQTGYILKIVDTKIIDNERSNS